MKCNIDARGRAYRLVSGILCLAIAAVLLTLYVLDIGRPLAMIGVAIGLGAAGAFQVFESRAGWCALRALGWRTPF